VLRPSSACLTSIATSFPSRPRPGKALVGQSRCWLPLLSGGGAYPARAEPFVAEQSQSEAAADPFAKFVAEAAQWFGVPILWINAVMVQESGGDVRALLTGGRWASCRLCLMPGPVRGPAMAWASILLTPATTFLLALRTCGRCTTATGRLGFWQPTMQPQALRGVPGDGSAAADRDAALRHDTRANDRRDAG
jgi:hypothetical protein